MVAKGSDKKRCTDVLNLPEEMQEALDRKDGLAGLKRLVPEKEDLVAKAEAFHALSEPSRLQILHALLVTDLCPCILREITGLSDSQLSYHLNILEKMRMIKSIPNKKWRIYTLTKQGKVWLRG